MTVSQINKKNAQRLRLTRRFIAGGAENTNDRYFVVYVAIISLLLLIAPLFWSTTLLIRATRTTFTVADVAWLCLAVVGVLLIGASLLPRYLGPIWTTTLELFYFIMGPFGVYLTLWRRLAIMCFSLTLLGMVGGSAAWLASDSSIVRIQPFLALGLAGGSLVAICALFNQTGWLSISRPIFGLLGLTCLGVAVLRAQTAFGDFETIVAFCGAAVAAIGMIVTANFALRRLRANDLDLMTARRGLAFSALAIGDSRAFETETTSSRGPRIWKSGFSRKLIVRSIQIDLRYYRRSPAGLVSGLAVVIISVLICSLTGPSAFSLAVVFYSMQLGLTQWTAALRDVADFRGADPILSERLLSRALSHLVLPLALLVVATVMGAGAGWIIGGAAPSTAWMLFWIALLAGFLRFASIGSGGIPASMMMPIVTPMGDLSSLVLVAWLLRSLLPGVLLIWVCAQRGPVIALAVVTVSAITFFTVKARELHKSSKNATLKLAL